MARSRVLDDDETKMEFEFILTADEVVAIRCLLGGITRSHADRVMQDCFYSGIYKKKPRIYLDTLFGGLYDEVDRCTETIRRISF